MSFLYFPSALSEPYNLNLLEKIFRDVSQKEGFPFQEDGKVCRKNGTSTRVAATIFKREGVRPPRRSEQANVSPMPHPFGSPHGDGGHVSEANAGDELRRRLLAVDVPVHPSGAGVDGLDGAEEGLLAGELLSHVAGHS